MINFIMEKDLGRIRKKEDTEIVVRLDDFGGRLGLTVREFVTNDQYTGFTKKGTRIPADSIAEFKDMLNKISEEEIKQIQEELEEKSQANETEKSQDSEEKQEEQPDDQVTL